MKLAQDRFAKEKDGKVFYSFYLELETKKKCLVKPLGAPRQGIEP